MVQGIKELEEKLKRAIPQAVKREVQLTMEKTANEIVATMKNMVPVDTGELKDSIGWTWGKIPDGATMLGSGSADDNLRITIYAGNAKTIVGERVRFQLAKIIEFGSQKMKAQPFFFPVWRSMKSRVHGRITRAIKKGLQN